MVVTDVALLVSNRRVYWFSYGLFYDAI